MSTSDLVIADLPNQPAQNDTQMDRERYPYLVFHQTTVISRRSDKIPVVYCRSKTSSVLAKSSGHLTITHRVSPKYITCLYNPLATRSSFM